MRVSLQADPGSADPGSIVRTDRDGWGWSAQTSLALFLALYGANKSVGGAFPEE
jgi:hypothetical protein